MKIKYLPCILLSFLVFGCVTEEIVYNVKRNEEFSRCYIVQSDNESLADVARRFTGSASNWQLLASYNPYINSYHLRRGDKINIPKNLMIDGENLWFEQEAAWKEKKKEVETPPTPEPTQTIIKEVEVETFSPVPTPYITETDLTISPYDLEERKSIRNEVLSDILNE